MSGPYRHKSGEIRWGGRFTPSSEYHPNKLTSEETQAARLNWGKSNDNKINIQPRGIPFGLSDSGEMGYYDPREGKGIVFNDAIQETYRTESGNNPNYNKLSGVINDNQNFQKSSPMISDTLYIPGGKYNYDGSPKYPDGYPDDIFDRDASGNFIYDKQPRSVAAPPVEPRSLRNDQISEADARNLSPGLGNMLDQIDKNRGSSGGFNKEVFDRDFESNLGPGMASPAVMEDYYNPATGEKTQVTAGYSPKPGSGWQSVPRKGFDLPGSTGNKINT